MKGIVFNLFEQLVVRDHGEATWDLMLERAGLDGVYTALGDYSHEHLAALIGVAAEALERSPEDVTRWYGRQAVPLLAQHFPAVFEPHDDARSFVLTLNTIIHPEVRKRFPGATPPDFAFDASEPRRLVMDYDSPRRMCAFAEGLLLGTGDHFQETLAISQPECMHRGDERCRIQVDFPPR